MQGVAARNYMPRVPQYAVASNLARFDPRSRVREAAQDLAAQKKAKAEAAPRIYMRLSPVAFFSFVCAAALLLLIVFSCMQLSVLGIENSRLAKELGALREEEKTLANAETGAVNLSELENYARYELGMVKPDKDHVVYVNLSGKDHGVAYHDEGFSISARLAASGFWDWLKGFFS